MARGSVYPGDKKGPFVDRRNGIATNGCDERSIRRLLRSQAYNGRFQRQTGGWTVWALEVSKPADYVKQSRMRSSKRLTSGRRLIDKMS